MFDSIDSKTIEHDGFTVTIHMVPDSDSTPFDADCYSASDIAAWRNDEWQYVGFIYSASRNGVQLGEASIWGTELDFPGGTIDGIDAWIAENYYHPDLLAECADDARATLSTLIDAA